MNILLNKLKINILKGLILLSGMLPETQREAFSYAGI
jgi:hypothetical protein